MTYLTCFVATLLLVQASAYPSNVGNPCSCPHPTGRLHCKDGAQAEIFEASLTGSASTKLDAMWGRIIENPKSHGFANPLYTLYMARNTTYTKEMGSKTFGDVRAPGHEKITHGTAAHAKAHFVWKDNGYTGMLPKPITV